MIQLHAHDNYHRSEIKALLYPVLSTYPELRARLDELPCPSRRLRVLLKPNFVVPAPRSDASTTHPEFYMAIAELLIELGCDVGIGESPAIGSCAGGLKAHGVYKECLERDIEIVEFKSTQEIAGVSEQASWQTLTIAAELRDWDMIINCPKLKTHQQFTFTGATKNLYGCVTGKRKFFRHNQCGNDPRRFASMIRANADAANCLLHIGDGIDAMHVKGPRGGRSFPLQRILIANDHLLHDWLFCHLIGLQPQRTPLFADLPSADVDRLTMDCAAVLNDPCFRVAEDFIHAPLIDISFQPWHLLRSGWRTLRYRLQTRPV